MKEREQYIDIAKIIGIFLVICGHYVYFMHILKVMMESIYGI